MRSFRRRQDLTLNQLAERCAELGAAQLTFSALANIERGATAESKRKPREVSLDELAVIARALNVPPVLLMFPIGTGARVQVTPGFDIAAWDAAQWFSGELFLTPDVETHFASPVYLFRRHTQVVDDYLATRDSGAEISEQTEQTLRGIRGEMRRHGLTPPRLPAELAGVDQVGAVRMTSSSSLTVGEPPAPK